MADMKKTSILHQRIYDFLLYVYPLLDRYPKREKFTLQTQTKSVILDMLRCVIKWEKTGTKSHVYSADVELQELKELIRLANDLGYSSMNAQHYGESCKRLTEIGCIMHGVIESLK
jgi:hypothetical protein